jgi:transcription factor IIIB 90 kDa subunit
VNVFELGHTYLQLVQVLNLRLPPVDPSHYISRFAALLEFGDETNKVATDAVRLVSRFDRDWMTKGRRPAGICGAALLLAARMNNFRRSVEEIVQVVKIADTTLKKRLDEFKSTPSGQLTLADFRSVWLEAEMDPPAFTKGREQEERERSTKEEGLEVEEWTPELEEQIKAKRKKKRKREEVEGENELGEDGKKKKKKKRRKGGDVEQRQTQTSAGTPVQTDHRIPIDPALLQEGMQDGILEGVSDVAAAAATVPPPPPLIEQAEEQPATPTSSPPEPSSESNEIEEEVSKAVAEEVSLYLTQGAGSELTGALDESEQRRLARLAETVVDELVGLDEEELDQFILTEEEVKIKERVWVEINKDYLEALAGEFERGSRRSFCSTEISQRNRNRRPRVEPRSRVARFVSCCWNFFFSSTHFFSHSGKSRRPNHAMLRMLTERLQPILCRNCSRKIQNIAKE